MEERLRMIKCTVPVCNVPSSSFRYVEEKLLAGLEDYLKGVALEEERLSEGFKTSPQENPYPGMIEQINKELNALEKQKRNIHNAFERGVYDDGTFIERIKDVSEQVALAKKNLDVLQEENKKFIINQKAIPETKKIITSVIEGYKLTTDVSIQNRLLRSVIDKVIYKRKPGSQKADFELEIYVKNFVDMMIK